MKILQLIVAYIYDLVLRKEIMCGEDMQYAKRDCFTLTVNCPLKIEQMLTADSLKKKISAKCDPLCHSERRLARDTAFEPFGSL